MTLSITVMSAIMWSVVMLSIVIFIVMLSDFMLNVVMLSYFMLSVVMPHIMFCSFESHQALPIKILFHCQTLLIINAANHS